MEEKQREKLIQELSEAALDYSESESVKKPRERIDSIKDEQRRKVEDNERKINENADKIDARTVQALQIFAIFTVLFTFLSINISIFSRVPDVITAAWFMVLMIIGLVFLLAVFFMLLSFAYPRTEMNKRGPLMIACFAFTVILVLFGLLYWPNGESIGLDSNASQNEENLIDITVDEEMIE